MSPGGRRPPGKAAGDPAGSGQPATRPDLEGLLAGARRGEAEARESLVRRYTPFVLRVASQAAGRYVELGRDDEASVALVAFNEAIDRYDPARGTSFLGFAATVIRRRLVDHFRHDLARRREVPLSVLGGAAEAPRVSAEEPPGETETALSLAEQAYREQEEAQARLEEVRRYRELLAAYGISLAELVRLSPRHADARRRAVAAARLLAGRPELAGYLRARGELPLRSLEQATGLSRKTLERQRKYIIAVALILLEDLPYLEAYLE
ncbi:MAG: RNA polymerase sigma-I factor [Firmicutes bacterium]|nr:RNA polymerase sigma-I factor [Bacillota bacterium]